jgi:hypothetical protein
MERSVAVKKLHKLLGKGFGYRVDAKAPLQDDRDKARAAIKDAIAERDRLRAECDARRKAVLDGDEEYQKRYNSYKAARECVDSLSSISHRYRVTVGNSNGMFFSVKAQGDNWEEVFAKVAKHD